MSTPSRMKRKEICGWERAVFCTTDSTALPSVTFLFKNFIRAGVL